MNTTVEEAQADPGEGGVGGGSAGAGGDPLEQTTEILIPNGLYDEDKLAAAIGVQASLVIEQRVGKPVQSGPAGEVLLAPSLVAEILSALGIAKNTPRGLQAVADVDLMAILGQSTHDPAKTAPEPRQAVVAGFPVNEYLVQIRWRDERGGGQRRYARVTPEQRRRLGRGKIINVYPPTKGNHWDTKAPRKK